jgi:hypothetical protein
MSGFKMSRKLSSLTVGIVAFALTNLLLSSLADPIEGKSRAECVVAVAEYLKQIEIAPEVNTLLEKSREFYKDDEIHTVSKVSDEYIQTMGTVERPDACEEIVSGYLSTRSNVPCYGSYLHDPDFILEVNQANAKAKEVLEAYYACEASSTRLLPGSTL